MRALIVLLWCSLVLFIAACAGSVTSSIAPDRAQLKPGAFASGDRGSRVRDVEATDAAYYNATPYANFGSANPTKTYVPFSFSGANTVTVEAYLKCKPQSNVPFIGVTSAQSPKGIWDATSGSCSATAASPNPDPKTTGGTNFEDLTSSIPVVPGITLVPGVTYFFAGIKTGSTLQYSLCAPTPGCSTGTNVSVADTNGFVAAMSGDIGGYYQHAFLGDLWGVQIWNYARTTQQLQADAAGGGPDPYPTSTANSNGSYTNTAPVSEGGALGGTTVGPAYAPDAFHIDWDAFCIAQSAHCTGGNPNYVSGDQTMIADTLSASSPATPDPYNAGVTSICNSAKSIVSGQTNGSPNSQCPFAVGTYYATSSDPLVTINCNIYPCGAGPSGSGTLQGAQIYIPMNALPQQNSDGHLSVKQPSGYICQIWLGANGTPGPGYINNQNYAPINSTSLNIGQGACGPSNETTEGSTLMSGGGYGGDDEMSRAFIRPEDIVGSNGDGTDIGDPYAFYHAFYAGFTNNEQGVVWPALAGDGRCTSSNTINGVMPKEGMILYLDSAGFSKVQQWNPPPNLRWLKRALGAIHRHGIFDMDSSGCATQTSGLYINTLTWGSDVGPVPWRLSSLQRRTPSWPRNHLLGPTRPNFGIRFLNSRDRAAA